MLLCRRSASFLHLSQSVMDSNELVTLAVAVPASISMKVGGKRQHESILTGKLTNKELVRHESNCFNHCGTKNPVFKLFLKKVKSEMVGLPDRTRASCADPSQPVRATMKSVPKSQTPRTF